jgi:hypothetical protein
MSATFAIVSLVVGCLLLNRSLRWFVSSKKTSADLNFVFALQFFAVGVIFIILFLLWLFNEVIEI